jgi:hypothetical protein
MCQLPREGGGAAHHCRGSSVGVCMHAGEHTSLGRGPALARVRLLRARSLDHEGSCVGGCVHEHT